MIKSIINQNTDAVTTKLKEIYLVLRREGFFFLGGCLQFGMGELGRGRRMRNRGGESRLSGDIFTFVDGITDGLFLSVIPSTILTENWSRHCMEIQV